MNLAISNIAWPHDLEIAVAQKLQQHDVHQVEIAPTAVWPDPLAITPQEIEHYRKFWKDFDISIVAMQSLLYGRNDLTLFESEEKRNETITYLKTIISLASDLGVSALVFGSPKNRLIGNLSTEEIEKIAVDFFSELGRFAETKSINFCIEPNPTDYGCDYITTVDEGATLVRKVNTPGFGLHLDAGGIKLSNDPVPEVLINSQDLIKHFHISEPWLGPVGDSSDIVHHQNLATALKDIDYRATISIEMRSVEPEKILESVEKALEFSKNIYC